MSSKHLESVTMTATCCHTPLIWWILIPPEPLVKLNSFLCYFLFYHFKFYFTYQSVSPPSTSTVPSPHLPSITPPSTHLSPFRLGKDSHGNQQTMACQVEEILSAFTSYLCSWCSVTATETELRDHFWRSKYCHTWNCKMLHWVK